MAESTDTAQMTPSGRARGTVILETQGLTKWYGAVKALNDVDFTMRTHEVVALVGDNGAGKSTFAKLISGAITPTAGTIKVLGEEVAFTSPSDARAYGIETVYQDLALVPHIDVGGNLFLGRELTKFGAVGKRLGILDLKAMAAEARVSLDKLKVNIPSVRSPIGAMSGGQRQATAIARGVFWGSELVILDEPVAALGVQETEQALRTIEDVASTGVPLIVISHNLEHVFRVATRVVVFRLGRLAADLVASETDPSEVVGYITGATKAQNV